MLSRALPPLLLARDPLTSVTGILGRVYLYVLDFDLFFVLVIRRPFPLSERLFRGISESQGNRGKKNATDTRWWASWGWAIPTKRAFVS